MKKQVSIDELIELVLAKSKSTTDDESHLLRRQVAIYKHGQGNNIPPEWERYLPDLTSEEIKSRAHSLQFEYCECGCKCHVGTSKGLTYTIFNTLEGEKSCYLFRGHGRSSPPIKRKCTFDEAVMSAQADYDKIP